MTGHHSGFEKVPCLDIAALPPLLCHRLFCCKPSKQHSEEDKDVAPIAHPPESWDEYYEYPHVAKKDEELDLPNEKIMPRKFDLPEVEESDTGNPKKSNTMISSFIQLVYTMFLLNLFTRTKEKTPIKQE